MNLKQLSLVKAATPSMLGLLCTSRTDSLYTLWFKVRFGPQSSLTHCGTVVADNDFAALKLAFKEVMGELATRGARLLDFKLVRGA